MRDSRTVAAIGLLVVAVAAALVGLLTDIGFLIAAGIAGGIVVLVVLGMTRWGGGKPVGEPGGPAEQDVASDPGVASTRETGTDGHDFVGRVEGEDDSAAERTGAEVRAQRRGTRR
ncbi:hypothetical protein V5P93_003812 [Actinokineospora auranticolor]|uniref:Uncharacterized protein n=1 Tax=Actinokineospora auranticolor TaxID=155976 RepID=A0A2S6GLJ2_9PSEU|nr:hypothetical protein [Actinokineospora auranticolor]PPK66099.1 hypothetical protein CLV40_11163 [Actinokineospora auranticolor]